MSGLEIVAAVLGSFFVVGIGAGVLLVIALPALGSIRRAGVRRLRHGRSYLDGGDWRQELPPPPRGGGGEKPPRWPGG